MLSKAQLQKIGLLSDIVLYPEAIKFIRNLVEERSCSPLPTSQVKGLQSIAESCQYDEIHRYIFHQYKERSWPEKKQSIGILYEELDRLFTNMKNRRLRDEFHLMSEGLSSREAREESNELMALLACEFIQHMVAENGLLEVEEKARKAEENARKAREQREWTNRR